MAYAGDCTQRTVFFSKRRKNSSLCAGHPAAILTALSVLGLIHSQCKSRQQCVWDNFKKLASVSCMMHIAAWFFSLHPTLHIPSPLACADSHYQFQTDATFKLNWSLGVQFYWIQLLSRPCNMCVFSGSDITYLEAARHLMLCPSC